MEELGDSHRIGAEDNRVEELEDSHTIGEGGNNRCHGGMDPCRYGCVSYLKSPVGHIVRARPDVLPRPNNQKQYK